MQIAKDIFADFIGGAKLDHEQKDATTRHDKCRDFQKGIKPIATTIIWEIALVP